MWWKLRKRKSCLCLHCEYPYACPRVRPCFELCACAFLREIGKRGGGCIGDSGGDSNGGGGGGVGEGSTQ
ncbi:hypothetical protein M0804_009530 [Polistes exclamans]|nr:hypothetical protein M0804_009530 [Polistes exclamans]